jgi:hypothetical protein
MKEKFYTVKYGVAGKPTTIREGKFITPDDFESLMNEDILNIISQRVYEMDIAGLRDFMVIKRGLVTEDYCEYKVVCKDLNNISKVMFEYEVEITCLNNPTNMDLTAQD